MYFTLKYLVIVHAARNNFHISPRLHR